MLEVKPTEIPEVVIIEPRRYSDDRGFFSEVYNSANFTAAGIGLVFVQDNHSYSEKRGTIRGLHFQSPPHAQAKLVRVVRGRVLDVAVDLRRSSPTFGRHVAVELSAENWRQLLVPVGFAHGYCTLTAHCELLYKVTDYYAPAHDHGLAFNDPALAISWPESQEPMLLSAKDHNHPRLAELPAYFD